MASRDGFVVPVALGLAAMLGVACHPPPVSPGPPAGVDPLQLPLVPRRLMFPSGPALLHVWGYSAFTDGPLCEPAFGTRQGSSVSAVVIVAADDAGWLVTADQVGRLEMHVRQTGRTSVEGEGVAGVARGSMRDAPVPPAVARNLSVDVPPDGRAVVEGRGSTARPYFQGTITGPIRYADSSGGVTTCPLVFWSLSPIGSEASVFAQGSGGQAAGPSASR